MKKRIQSLDEFVKSNILIEESTNKKDYITDITY